MNAIVTAFAEQGLVLGAILLLAIYLQAKIHHESTALRKEMTGMRREMSDMKDDLRKEMSDMKDDLRKDMNGLGTRLARVEGALSGGAAYEAVAEPPSDE